MIDELNNILKKYISIFVEEYDNYLSKEQLELLKDINFANVIKLDGTSKPFGIVSLGQINLADYSAELINNLKRMNNYNSNHTNLNNKNISSYLEYMCNSGYKLIDYYNDILMYFVFWLVIRNTGGLINGLINQEIKYLSKKYSLRLANLYPREEAITSKIDSVIEIDGRRSIIFYDRATSFKYLNDTKGFSVAKLVTDVEDLIEDEYQSLSKKEYIGYQGFLDYATDYDHLSYGDVYNCILEFKAKAS